MPLQGSLSIEQMCHLAEVSRAGFYRYLRGGWPAEEELTLRSAVQEIVLEHRWRYGYRRVTAELRLRGMIANHKRVARIMHEDNLLAVRRGRLLSDQGSIRAVGIYLNLANRMRPSGPNQLWIGDITYIRLSREFVYLAVILDAFSRKVIGWSLGRTLQTRLPLRALEQPAPTWSCAPLRSGCAVRLSAVHAGTSRERYAVQYEQAQQSLRQCHLREFLEDVKARRDLHQCLP
jgi:putative transposase